MAIRLPEVLRHLPHTPVPESKGKSRWHQNPLLRIGVGLATLTASAGIAYQLFFSPDRGPSAAPVDNAPISDTLKPPPGPVDEQPILVPLPSQSPDNPSVSAPAGGTGPDGSPDPKPKPESKVEPFDCGILSPEACATGEYIEWKVPKGPQTTETIPVRGIGFILKKGEEFKIPEDLQVAAQPVKQPNVYRGYRISGASKKDGRDFTILGDSVPKKDLSNVGKDLPAGTVVGTSDGSGLTVFEGYPYTHVLLATDLNTRFPNQTKGQPEIINNTPPSSPPPQGGGLTFFDVPPPKG